MKIQSSFPLRTSPEQKLKEQDGQLREAAKMYENHFLNEMVKAMRSTVKHDDGLIKQNFGEKIFSEQLDQQYVDGWANKGGVGLADLIYNQLRERLMPVKKDFGKAPMALPIKAVDPIQMKAIPSGKDSRLEYRFEVQDPSGAAHDAINPMAGTVKDAQNLGEGWNLVRMDHGQGIESEMTFPGRRTEYGIGDRLETGQKLGLLDPRRPVLAWKLDWS